MQFVDSLVLLQLTVGLVGCSLLVVFLYQKKSVHLSTPSYVTQFRLYFATRVRLVIRFNGRIKIASLPMPTKNPILLLSNQELVRFFIHESHCAVKHNGIKDTLMYLREDSGLYAVVNSQRNLFEVAECIAEASC